MKNLIYFFAITVIAFIFSSCGDSNIPQEVKIVVPETYCHTELVYHPLETSVVAVPYRVQKGDGIGDIVRMHKTDPNQVGGPFLDYTEEMFLKDNPEVVSTTKRSIRKDRCDPNKVDTVFYKSWNLKENDLVYLRIPARIDTVDNAGPNVVWFTPEKVSHVRQVTERAELLTNNLKPQPVTDVRENLCPGDGIIFPGKPVVDNGGVSDEMSPSSRFVGWWRGFFSVIPPSWILGCLAFIFLIFWVWKVGRQTQRVVRDSHDETRKTNNVAHEETRAHVTKEHAATFSGMTEVASAISQQTSATGKTNELLQKMLEQLDKKKKGVKS